MTIFLLILIYIFYIGLGLPDSLLGAAWPAMYGELGVPVSYASLISAIISGGTVLSSLASAKAIARFGTAKVTAFSTSLAAVGLLGFSLSQNFLWLCFCAVPLGIGAGSIDTALNNYVAVRYNAGQMSFLHCFYGIGVTVSPYLMSLALSDELDWRGGYRTVFFIQLGIALLSYAALPLWKKVKAAAKEEEPIQVLTIPQMLRQKKIWASCGVYVGISALESTCLIWGGTYLTEALGLSADAAAARITLYFVGMTLGRFLSGVSGLSKAKISGWRTIGLSQCVLLFALCVLLLRPGVTGAVFALFCIGLGNGPIFPSITHLTPTLYGRDVSQSVIGIQMAFSNLSILLTPILFGVVSRAAGIRVFPVFLTCMFVLLVVCTVLLYFYSAKPRGSKRANQKENR